MISIDFRQIWVFSTPMFDSRWLHKKLGSVPWCERWEDGKIGYIAVKDAAGNDIVEPIKVGCRFGGKLFCQSASPYGEWQGETGSYFFNKFEKIKKRSIFTGPGHGWRIPPRMKFGLSFSTIGRNCATKDWILIGASISIHFLLGTFKYLWLSIGPVSPQPIQIQIRSTTHIFFGTVQPVEPGSIFSSTLASKHYQAGLGLPLKHHLDDCAGR